jgi:hypothetical protein
VQEEDIAAETVSAPVRMIGYDTKKGVNEQGRMAPEVPGDRLWVIGLKGIRLGSWDAWKLGG